MPESAQERLITKELVDAARSRAHHAAAQKFGPEAVSACTVVEGLELNSYTILTESPVEA